RHLVQHDLDPLQAKGLAIFLVALEGHKAQPAENRRHAFEVVHGHFQLFAHFRFGAFAVYRRPFERTAHALILPETQEPAPLAQRLLRRVETQVALELPWVLLGGACCQQPVAHSLEIGDIELDLYFQRIAAAHRPSSGSPMITRIWFFSTLSPLATCTRRTIP